MEKQNKLPALNRRNRLAATFPNVQDLNEKLPESSAIDLNSPTMTGNRKPPQRNILPAGAEGELTIGGTKFYYDSKEPETNGTIMSYKR